MRLDVAGFALPVLFACLAAGAAPSDSDRPAMPRILLREHVAGAAHGAGFDTLLRRPDVYRVGTDSGEILSLMPPEAIGGGRVRILRMEAGGVLRGDTLASNRIAWVEAPTGSGVTWELPIALAFGGFLPFMLTGSNPVFGIVGLSAVSVLAFGPPEYRRYPGQDFFGPGARLRGAVAMTMEGATRNAFNPEDRRHEIAPSWNLQAEVGSPISCLAVSLSARLGQVTRPWTTEAIPFSMTSGFRSSREDSLYALAGAGFALSPAVKITLLETRRLTFHTQLGGYWSWLPGTSLPVATGGAVGAELDLWLTEALGLRTSAALLLPQSDYRISVSSSVGAGVAYRFGSHALPVYQPAVFVSILDLVTAQGLAPDLGLGVEQGEYQTLGLRVWNLWEKWHTLAVYTESSNESQGYSNRLGCEVQYGLHSDRAERFFGGLLISAGVTGLHSNENNLNQSPFYPSANTYLDDEVDLSVAAGLEAGVRLAAGFGLLAQWRPLTTASSYAGTFPPLSLGLTYRIPAQGERR